MRNPQQVILSRLLLVDDDPLIRLSMAAALDENGFSVRSAEDGPSALAEIGREIPDIVLSDLNMPRMSGFEFLKIARRHFPSIYLIAMSAAFSGDEVPSGVTADAFYQRAGGVRCLLKIVERFAQSRPIGMAPALPSQRARRETRIDRDGQLHSPSEMFRMNGVEPCGSDA